MLAPSYSSIRAVAKSPPAFLLHHAHRHHTTHVHRQPQPTNPKDRRPRNKPLVPKYTQFDINADNEATPVVAAETSHYSLNRLMATTEMPEASTCTSRDFIHNALYNPHYGYFSKHARIFKMLRPIDCTQLHSTLDFMNVVAKQYAAIENQLDSVDDVTRQIWHTPTELFKPWYGEAIAAYILATHIKDYGPSHPLLIYEVGGGNGTLMTNILDYIQATAPATYATTQYRILEISANLAAIQQLSASHHAPRVEIIHQSVFSLDISTSLPCFFIALEVVDNLAHDIVRWDHRSRMPYCATVSTDQFNDFSELYVPVSDPLLSRTLALHAHFRHWGPTKDLCWNMLGGSPIFRRAVLDHVPFVPNLSKRAFVPSNLVALLETLKVRFPNHRLVMSDFSFLPDTISNERNAPVVQTRFRNAMIPVSTYLVHPGFFDIFFPTNFFLVRDMYGLIMRPEYNVELVSHLAMDALATCAEQGSSVDLELSVRLTKVVPPSLRTKSSALVLSHRDFLLKYANLSASTTKSGENPMLMYYENCKFLLQ